MFFLVLRSPSMASLKHERLYITRLLGVALSVKRSLNGQTGYCPKTYLLIEFPDFKIVGQVDGQKANNDIGWLCASIDGGTGHSFTNRCAAKSGLQTNLRSIVSGAKAERPGLASALEFLREGDALVVWRLDRLGRSLPHLIETVSALEALGVGFRSLTEVIDTTTPGRRLIFHVFGALGQFERDLIRDRTKAGLAAAAARGRKGGRKPVITPDRLPRARDILPTV